MRPRYLQGPTGGDRGDLVATCQEPAAGPWMATTFVLVGLMSKPCMLSFKAFASQCARSIDICRLTAAVHFLLAHAHTYHKGDPRVWNHSRRSTDNIVLID